MLRLVGLRLQQVWPSRSSTGRWHSTCVLGPTAVASAGLHLLKVTLYGTCHNLTRSLNAVLCCAVLWVLLQGLQDGRFTLTGVAKPLSESDKAAAREVFLAKYPNAFYVDFGDFRWFRVEELTGGRYVGGFGRVASVSVGFPAKRGRQRMLVVGCVAGCARVCCSWGPHNT